MKATRFLATAPTALLLLLICSGKPETQRETVLSAYRTFILNTTPRTNTDSLLASLNTNGQWDDISYNDSNPAVWRVSRHLDRVRQLALAWNDPQSKFYRSDSLHACICRALDVWLNRRFVNPNWWHNEIGVPRYMRDIIILMDESLDANRCTKAIEVLAQLKILRQGEGANLIWSADLGFHYALLTNQPVLADSCIRLIVNEIKINPEGDGIKPDYSFQQHGAHLQMYQYGRAFVEESIRLAWQTQHTRWAFPPEKIKILTDFILNGWQWMARGINTVPGTIDRSVSRAGELRSADIRKLIPFLAELNDSPRRADIQRLANIQNGRDTLSGYRHFPFADFTACHFPHFSFFVKTLSTRTLPTEQINAENLAGHLLSSGDAYTVRNGNEYFNLMPIWDWERLPGITTFTGADHIVRRPLVGSISTSEMGLTAMDYCIASRDSANILTARKCWACYDGMVVYMLADIATQGAVTMPITAIDQARLQSNVFVNQILTPTPAGISTHTNTRWILHNHMLYQFPDTAQIELTIGQRSGRWADINHGESPETVTDSIFCPVMIHQLPARRSTAYAISYCDSPSDVQAAITTSRWQIVQNDSACQAILFDNRILMAAFYHAQHPSLFLSGVGFRPFTPSF